MADLIVDRKGISALTINIFTYFYSLFFFCMLENNRPRPKPMEYIGSGKYCIVMAAVASVWFQIYSSIHFGKCLPVCYFVFFFLWMNLNSLNGATAHTHPVHLFGDRWALDKEASSTILALFGTEWLFQKLFLLSLGILRARITFESSHLFLFFSGKGL